MKLSKSILQRISTENNVDTPGPSIFSLPDKVLQFGTGAFLRGLIDCIINNANNEKIFNGRIVLVKSTEIGTIDSFKEQDNLYTLIMRSIENDVKIEKKMICASISRVINAKNWDQVLNCAFNEDLKIIISNTTEVGIVMENNDSIHSKPPISFPGKLLSFLYERYRYFNGKPESGMVIIPTELILDNATKLKKIVNQLALQNKLEDKFITWLNTNNEFCNSLVDRIVPGRPTVGEQLKIQELLGYEDDLMIESETYGLWAIETKNSRTQNMLSFSKAFAGVHIVPNIDKFRELKLRLLNGSHNLSCAIGFIAGFNTVDEAMADPVFDLFMRKLINNDIANAIVSENISIGEAQEFGSKVIERYRNPYIKFDWLNICVQDTAKIKIRAVPIVEMYYEKYGFVADSICLGFAAYILFMRGTPNQGGGYTGCINEKRYIINDDFAETLYHKWINLKGFDLVQSILNDKTLWDIDLTKFSGFSERVHILMRNLSESGFSLTTEFMIN